MTRNRLTLIAVLSLLVVWLWKLAANGREERERYDAWLLGMDADDAWEHGYDLGRNGEPGYWPDYERTSYDEVPGVGRVPRESPEERAYWAGWHLGEEDRPHWVARRREEDNHGK